MPPDMTDAPLDDIRALIADAPRSGPARPPAADLGQLGDLAAWVIAWRGEATLRRPILALYAGAHAGADVADTRAFMEQVAAGDAAISRAAGHLGAGLDVYDLALDRPLPSPPTPAMSERECAATMAFGMEVLAKQPDLLVLVGLGPGADASARAVIAAIEAGDSDPLDALRSLGGRESAAVAGAIIAARMQRIPVLLDGLPALAAALALRAHDATATDHVRWAGPTGATPLTGLPDLGVTRADGTAALAALCLIKFACAMAAPAS
jgi:nicotinate-nucleotide--dimethylbenzimidazole phosphoribosyltransferase